MGVPRFSKWLLRKYPNAVVKAREEKGEENGVIYPTQTIEVDNLYLDLDHIFHQCRQGNRALFRDRARFKQFFESISECINRIVHIVRPIKLLYLAIDGEAPSAKMKGPRSKHSQNAKQVKFKETGGDLRESLSKKLKHYIHLKLKNDPGWKDMKVILSDASVLGEGEHKIMSFIRLQQKCNGYNTNTSHCVYGQDADLIMLALATREVHFFILRDVDRVNESASLAKMSYQFLKIQELRKSLIRAMKITEPPKDFWINPDRFIDDFIFLCFFLGNDFLPPLLSLETHENAVNSLMVAYKKNFKSVGGYLIDTQQLHEKHDAYINLKGVQQLMGDVSSFGGKELKEQEFQKYLEGLYWVLRYYFGAVCSWSWYYGKHDDATCPSESTDAFPEADKAPMICPESNVHPPGNPEADKGPMICSESNVHPPGSNVDEDEKQNMPQGEEVRRKEVAHEMIFVRASHALGPQVASLYHGFVHASGNEQTINKITIDSEKSDGLNGFLMRCECDKQLCIDDDSSSLLKGMEKNDVLCAIFENPLFDHHNPEPPKHVTMPEKTIEKRMLWHEHYGNQQRENRGIQGRKNGGFGQLRYAMLAHILVDGLRADADDTCRSNSLIPEALENDSRADRSDNRRSTPQPPEAPGNGSRAERSDNWRSTQPLAAPGNISRADRNDNWRSTQPPAAPGNGSRADMSDNWRSTPQPLAAPGNGSKDDISVNWRSTPQLPAAPRNGSRADMSDNWKSTSQPPAAPTYRGRGRGSSKPSSSSRRW